MGMGSALADVALGHVRAGAEHKFLCDHVVDGRILMPATSYVVTAWEALCNMKTRKMEETPVTFEDVQIRQAVTAEEGQKIALAVLIAPDNRFCVSRQPVVRHNAVMRPFLHSHSLASPASHLASAVLSPLTSFWWGSSLQSSPGLQQAQAPQALSQGAVRHCKAS